MEIYIYSGGWSSSAEVPAAHTPAVPPATQESEVLAIAPGPEHDPPKALYPEPHAQPALGSLSAETPIEHHVDAVFELAPKPLKHGTSASSTLFPVIQLELGAALAELPISQSDDKLLFKTFKFGRIYFISFNFNFSTPKNQCKKKNGSWCRKQMPTINQQKDTKPTQKPFRSVLNAFIWLFQEISEDRMS